MEATSKAKARKAKVVTSMETSVIPKAKVKAKEKEASLQKVRKEAKA